MDALSVSGAALAGGILLGTLANVPQVVWEYVLHRRTVREVQAEGAEVRQRVDSTISKAQADRDAILGRVVAVEGRVAAEVAGVIARVDAAVASLSGLIERETQARIAAAREQMQAEAEAMRAEVEAQVREAEAALVAKRAEVEAKAAEVADQAARLATAAEMARRGAAGNEAKREKGGAVAEMLSALEARFGTEVVDLLQERAPKALALAERYPERAERILGPAIQLIMGGTLPQEGGAPSQGKRGEKGASSFGF